MNNLKFSNSDAPGARQFRHIVSAGESGQRVDQVMSHSPHIHSREMAQRLIDSGDVLVNAASTKAAARVKSNDLIEFNIPPPTPAGVTAQHGALDILHEDSAVIVVNKQTGLPVHPGAGHEDHTLVNYLLGHCRDLSGIGGELRPGIVHRLDKDTSGVMVAAKHDGAHLGLSEQFKARSIHRRYVAVVIGVPDSEAGTIDRPLGRDSANRAKRVVRADGKRAITHWEVLERHPPFSLVQLRLETGRTHQIRAHLCEANWPVMGDPLYGGRRHRGLQAAPVLREVLDAFDRQALHAVELGFVHPETDRELRFSAAMPADMQTLWNTIVAHG